MLLTTVAEITVFQYHALRYATFHMQKKFWMNYGTGESLKNCAKNIKRRLVSAT